jgi:methylmalonyl-CoA mutase
VNTFVGPPGDEPSTGLELARATEGEKASQIERLAGFKTRHAADAPAALERLRAAAAGGGNVFEALMDAVRHCTLGQITDAFFDVGGQYRRNV